MGVVGSSMDAPGRFLHSALAFAISRLCDAWSTGSVPFAFSISAAKLAGGGWCEPSSAGSGASEP
eukprot:3399710-Alexandrium_andersonii.AAC.1